MNLHKFLVHTGSRWLSVGLSALLTLSPIAFVNLTGLASERAGLGYASNASSKPLASIVVNTTGDGSNPNPNAGCDVDAGTAGEQCTLRAAIRTANALASDDQITFNIPLNEPNCDAMTGACYINLASALPNLSTNIEIIDTDHTGYDFWLTKLNQFNGNYINAEMVKALITSIEYRQRFGP